MPAVESGVRRVVRRVVTTYTVDAQMSTSGHHGGGVPLVPNLPVAFISQFGKAPPTHSSA